MLEMGKWDILSLCARIGPGKIYVFSWQDLSFLDGKTIRVQQSQVLGSGGIGTVLLELLDPAMPDVIPWAFQ